MGSADGFSLAGFILAYPGYPRLILHLRKRPGSSPGITIRHVYRRRCEERKRRSNPDSSLFAGLLRFARNDGPLTRRAKSAATSPRKRGEVRKPYGSPAILRASPVNSRMCKPELARSTI